jgi:hypothetical protein
VGELLSRAWSDSCHGLRDSFSGRTFRLNSRAGASLEHRLQQESLRTAGDEGGAELAQHGEVEAGIGQFQAAGVLPVNAGADGRGGLATIGDECCSFGPVR